MNEYKLGRMGNGTFTTRTLSSHLQDHGRRRRNSLRPLERLFLSALLSRISILCYYFGSFKHPLWPIQALLLAHSCLLFVVEVEFFYRHISVNFFYSSEHVSATRGKVSVTDYIISNCHSFLLVNYFSCYDLVFSPRNVKKV